MKKALIIVDFQNDFVSGTLGFDGAEKLDEILTKKIKKNRDLGNEIIFTRDTHFENYLETQEGKKLPVEHCIKDSDGWKIFGNTGLNVSENDPIFDKIVFGSAELFDYLREKDFEEIELGGLVSNICVISNAILAKTALPECKIVIDYKATDSYDKDLNEKTFDVLEGLQVNILNRDN